MERMLPWFHAYDRVNYARHFTYCWAALNNLAETNLKMYAEFQEGNFAVKRTSRSFSMLPPDQVIEQTINKDQKASGGIIGYTTSTGSIQRWVFSSHVIAKINADFQNSIDVVQSSNSVKDLGKKESFMMNKRSKTVTIYLLTVITPIRLVRNLFQSTLV